MTVEFKSTANRTEATRFYSIKGAPDIDYKQWDLSPCSAKFVFMDGEFVSVQFRGCVVLKNGALSDRFMTITTMHMWNQKDWPDWARRLRDLALDDFANNVQVEIPSAE